jgi:hypothetical protein
MKTQITEGLNQQTVDAYLEKRVYDALYWPTFFPLKNVNSLDAKTLIGAEGSRVAAHVISYNSKAPEATRKVMSTLSFDIPKTAQSRVKDEKQILEHAITKAIQGQNAVIEDYFADLDFVQDSCAAREEWFALQALSLTKIQLSTTNNPQGIVNETVIDFGMNDANKKCVSAVWATNAAKVVTDFTAVAKAGRALGLKFQYALMNQNAFDLAIAGTELISMFTGLNNVVSPIDLASVNRLLLARNLPQIVIIETYVGIENKAGTITQTNPWSDTHVLFVPEIVQGNMFNGPIAEEIEKPDGILQSKKGNVLVSVQKSFNPVRVVTKGECNVFPSWPKVNQCINMYTGNTSTWA